MSDFDYGYGMAERFTKDTAKHQMTVLHDEGLYRHLRFKTLGSSMYWFDLITIPETLIFQGDGTSYAFSRVTDMFDFFRGQPGRINPDYWSEKLTSTSGGRGEVRTYDEDSFKKLVVAEFVEAVRGGVPRGTGKALREQVLDRSEIYIESDACRLLAEFEHDGFRFADTWEWDFSAWDWWFLWACHAIVWGIAQYDQRAQRSPEQEPAVSAGAA